MRIRLLGVLAVLGAALSVVPAHATPCDLVLDAFGDVDLPPLVTHRSDLDILSADVATTATSIKAVFRMAQVSAIDLNNGPETLIRMTFAIGSQDYAIYVWTSAGTHTYAFLKASDPAVPAPFLRTGPWGTADLIAGEYRIEIPLSDISDLISVTPGTTTLTGIEMAAGQYFGVPAGPAFETLAPVLGGFVAPAGFEWDHAVATGSYLAGDVNCAS
jgi:hypothetical protein